MGTKGDSHCKSIIFQERSENVRITIGGLRPTPASEVTPKPQVLSFKQHIPLLKVLGHVFQQLSLSCFC